MSRTTRKIRNLHYALRLYLTSRRRTSTRMLSSASRSGRAKERTSSLSSWNSKTTKSKRSEERDEERTHDSRPELKYSLYELPLSKERAYESIKAHR